LFINSVIPYEYEPDIDDWVAKSDSVHYRRSEGWAKTKYGKYGVPAIKDISHLKGDVIAFWGDSFVAGFHVNDKKKIAQVFTQLSRQKGYSDLTAIGIGRAGANFADYYYKIPKYEKLTPIRAHIFVIAQISDLLPLENGNLGQFKSEPELAFVKSRWSLSRLKIYVGQILYKLRAQFIYKFIKTIRNTQLRFSPGIADKPSSKLPTDISLKKKKESIEFLLTNISKQTRLPIILIYCPGIPYIEENKISYKDNDQQLWQLTTEAAKTFGQIHCISMRDDFIKDYETTNRFSRGFLNTFPGKGHFNETGHRIIAKRVFDYVMEQKNAILSN
jgi:hypothetical protein